MASTPSVQLRWIWLSVYIISGCLFLAYAAFAAVDALPRGVFYTGFGAAGFIGAVIATAHSGGASVTETSIAAVLVGLLHLGVLVFGVGLGADTFPLITEPLSSTFVCFAGALAGGQLATRGHKASHCRESLPRLATTAIVILVGATASHAAALVILGSFSAPLALVLGIFLLFTTPAIAGYALQISTTKDVTSAIVYGITAVGLIAVLLFLVSQPYAYSWYVVCKSIMAASMLALFGGFALVLALPGILVAQTSKGKQTPRAAPLPKAFARIAARFQSPPAQ